MWLSAHVRNTEVMDVDTYGLRGLGAASAIDSNQIGTGVTFDSI